MFPFYTDQTGGMTPPMGPLGDPGGGGVLGGDMTPQKQALMSAVFSMLGNRQGTLAGIGNAGMAAMQTYSGAQDQALKRQLQNAQLGDIQQQAALRKAQAEKQAQLLESIKRWSDPTAGAFQTGQTALGAAKTAGMPSGPTNDAASLLPAAQQQVQQSNPLFGIPQQAVSADLAFNEGKGLSDMIYKRGTPNMQMHNGVALDMNRVTPGASIPQISQNGQASQLIPDPGAPGGYRVVAPTGALDTFMSYQNATKDAEARHDVVKVYNPTTQREEYVPRSTLLGQPQAQQPAPQPAPVSPQRAANVIPPGLQAQRDSESRLIMTAELARAQREGRTADAQGIQRELQRLPGGAPANNAAGPSTSEKTAAAAAGVYANDAAKSAAGYAESLNGRVSSGQDLMMRIEEARKALEGFKPGMGAEMRLNIARAAKALGAPDSVVTHINQGNVADKQEFQKLSAQQAMESLKQAMGGSGRITQAEFKVFQANNPNIELDPEAIRKIYDFTTKVYQRDLAEQQSYQKWLKGGGDPTQWASAWAGRRDPMGTGKMVSPGGWSYVGVVK